MTNIINIASGKNPVRQKIEKSSVQKTNFTVKYLDSLVAPVSGRAQYHDTKQPGLILRITVNGVKSFAVYGRVKGEANPIRKTLGRYPNISIEQARKQAKKVIAEMAFGTNPIKQEQDDRVREIARNITLGDAFNAYMSDKKLKPNTQKDYREEVKKSFNKWMNRPLYKISSDMVKARFDERTLESPARANNAMRVLRAIYNYASKNYRDSDNRPIIEHNPVTILSEKKLWNKDVRRRTYLKPKQIPKWLDAVISLDKQNGGYAEAARDLFLILLLTGFRLNEGAKLCWNQIDFESRTVTLFDTKNNEQHTVPLSDIAFCILECRSRNKTSDFVFPGNDGPIKRVGHWITEIETKSGVKWTPHDLRRTFATVADPLVSAYALKFLLNHKSGRQDVTAGYIGSADDVSWLINPTQAITDSIMVMWGENYES